MTPRDTQELVEAVRAGINVRDTSDNTPQHYSEYRHQAHLALDALAERTAELERELASTNDAALLLHKRVEELLADRADAETCRDEWIIMHGDLKERLEAQLAERDKRIEGLREALERIRIRAETAPVDWPVFQLPNEIVHLARVALADPVVVPQTMHMQVHHAGHTTVGVEQNDVVVPGWDDGTWKQEC